MLVIPYVAKVEFCFLTPNGINMAIFVYLLYNTYGMNSLSERLTDIIRILGDHLKSTGISIQEIVWTK